MKTEEERKRKELTVRFIGVCRYMRNAFGNDLVVVVVQGGALGIDAKRQRVTADAETARKDDGSCPT